MSHCESWTGLGTCRSWIFVLDSDLTVFNSELVGPDLRCSESWLSELNLGLGFVFWLRSCFLGSDLLDWTLSVMWCEGDRDTLSVGFGTVVFPVQRSVSWWNTSCFRDESGLQLLLWDQFETFNTVKSFKASSLEQTHHSGCNAGVRTLCRRRRPNEPESSLIPVEQLMSEPSVSERRLVSNCGPAGNWSWNGNTEEGETLGAILKSGFGVAAN